MGNSIFHEVDSYISDLMIHEDEVQLSIAQTMKDAGLPFSSISPNQGKFLYIMALACNAKKILELGTLGGYSTIWLAKSLPQDGKLITVELETAHATIAKRNVERAGLSDKVEFRIGKAINILEDLKLENEYPFDLIFIDADKPPYADYFLKVLELSRPGTLIIADNVIREGMVMDENTKDDFLNGVQRFNKTLADTPNVTSTIIQTVGIKPHDGISLSIVGRG
ncbi:MAG TPA: O-methyltransferase [Puia sp.]|jgi:caffeoyl-CoA O-methyltransferase|nr:O-methyltransferase [Puia sp.]